MEQLTLNCDTKEMKLAMIDFFKLYRSNMDTLLNTILESKKVVADSTMKFEGDGEDTVITIISYKDNKGSVTYTKGEEVSIKEHKDLEEGSVYMSASAGMLALYDKAAKGSPDVLLLGLEIASEGHDLLMLKEAGLRAAIEERKKAAEKKPLATRAERREKSTIKKGKKDE